MESIIAARRYLLEKRFLKREMSGALQLSAFASCMNTNAVKATVVAFCAEIGVKIKSVKIVTAAMQRPVIAIERIMLRLTKSAWGLRGGLPISPSEEGSAPSASAGGPSIMRFTQSICIAPMGRESPRKGGKNIAAIAATEVE